MNSLSGARNGSGRCGNSEPQTTCTAHDASSSPANADCSRQLRSAPNRCSKVATASTTNGTTTVRNRGPTAQPPRHISDEET